MSTRTIYCCGFIIIGLILGCSLYLQYYHGIIPCPLCTFQRIAFAALGITFFLGLFVARNGFLRQLVNVLIISFSGLGAFFAARQAWIQYFHVSDTNECGLSLQYMMKVLPWHEVVQKVFAGSAECADQQWSLLTLTMPEWAFLWFASFLLLGSYLLLKRR